jgi:hypothetical protein
MSLEIIFSQANMQAYSGACYKMATKMADIRKKDFPFDTLVIPSRGAFPFFLGMTHAFRKLQNVDDNIKAIYQSMAIQPMLEPLMPADSGISSDIHKKDLRVLLIPFTADLNIPKFDSEESNEEYTEKTRDYWARVTHSFFKEPSMRVHNPYFKTFTDIILRNIEGRSRAAEIYEEFPKIKKFAMIDTVISGRASNDILGAFDHIQAEQKDAGARGYEDIPPFAFLIVDDDGKKLQKHQGFNAYLQERKNGKTEPVMIPPRAQLYPIPRIVSEDENSSLLGVSASIYPSLMKASKSMEYNGREFFVGAGSWHVNPESQQFAHFLRFMDLVYSGIDVSASEFDFDEAHTKRLQGEFEEKRQDFVKATESSGVMQLREYDIASDKRLTTLNKGAVPIYETRSHVLHVPFNQRLDKSLCAQICNYDYVHCKQSSKNPDSSEATRAQNKKAAIYLPEHFDH